MVRVALVSEHASPLAAMGTRETGGQNRHVGALASALADLGHQVEVYTRRDSPTQPDVVRISRGVDVVHVPAGPAGPVPRDALATYMPRFGQWLRQYWSETPAPHVVHAHFWMSGAAARPVCQDLGLPFAQTFHALGSVKRRYQGHADTSPPRRQRVERMLGQRANAVIATCSDEVRELSRIGVRGDHIRVVPRGVDPRAFTPAVPAWPRPRRTSHRLVYLGRLVARKGIDTVIAALPGVPDTELVIAGGPPADQLASDSDVRRLSCAAAAAGVGDRVRLIGQVAAADVPSLLCSADLVVSVPVYEPFGMVPVEAMACGVPVVTSAVGGMLDTVVDGVTGRHVPPCDPVVLQRVLVELLSDDGQRLRMGSRAAIAARRYSWASIAERTTDIYSEIMVAPRVVGADRRYGSG